MVVKPIERSAFFFICRQGLNHIMIVVTICFLLPQAPCIVFHINQAGNINSFPLTSRHTKSEESKAYLTDKYAEHKVFYYQSRCVRFRTHFFVQFRSLNFNSLIINNLHTLAQALQNNWQVRN